MSDEDDREEEAEQLDRGECHLEPRLEHLPCMASVRVYGKCCEGYVKVCYAITMLCLIALALPTGHVA